MRRNYFTYYFVGLLLIIGYSCQKEIQLDLPGHEPKLILDGRIETGTPPIVLLSKSNDIYAPTSLADFAAVFQSGAEVTVSNGIDSILLDEICSDDIPDEFKSVFAEQVGISEEILNQISICFYTTLNTVIFGEVGRTYYLTVKHENQVYQGETTLLPPVPLDSLYWKEDQKVKDNGLSWATLSDPPGQYDAYFWEVKRLDRSLADSLQDVYRPTFNPVFDDTFFDGMTFNFAYENPHNFRSGTPSEERGFYQRGDTVVVKFSKLDVAVYQFYEKKYIQLQSGGSPFANPINIPSNMSNGLRGVWAGFSPVYDTLFCD
jgi:hypothetical protein